MKTSEMETIITFDETELTAEIYTTSVVRWTMLEREGLTAIKITEKDGEITSKTFNVPRHAIRVKPFRKAINFGGGKKRVIKASDDD